MNTAGHYRVHYHPRYGEITHLSCIYCPWSVGRYEVGQPRSSRSGLGRYNRMLGQVRHHLHAEHRDKLIQVAIAAATGGRDGA